MIQSIDDKILVKVNKSERGSLFFVEDFLFLGISKAVSKKIQHWFL
jgi:hypothetical protein